ncbi:MAG: hypothetical protein ACPHVV_04655, partial [Porticoccaceae bacterium]
PIQTIISVPEQIANTQHVYVSDSQLAENGSQVIVTLSYKADNPNTTGVGFTVNFDSNILSMNSVSDVFSGAIASGDLNAEGDGLDFGWASLFGQFPGYNEVDLAKITFDINPSVDDGAGAVFRIDNAKIYDPNTSESFNGFVLLGNNPEDPWSIWDCCGGSTPSLQMDDAGHGIVAEFTIGANPTLAGLRIAQPGVYMDVSSVLENGIVQFDLKVIEPLT